MQLKSAIRFGQRLVGRDQPCFIVFEAGATHNGFDNAMTLVDLAAEAGADAIKFQKFDPMLMFADPDIVYPYVVLADRETGRTEEVREPHLEQRKRMELTEDQWRRVKARCDEKGICFFATVGDPAAVDLMAELGAPCLKLCSGDINYWPLLERVCAVDGVSIQLDIGSATVAEVERAVDFCLARGRDRIIINHCPTGYPASADKVNLNILSSLHKVFGCPVAFSDHSPGLEMDIAALCMGADILEKTITLDRTIRSPEHIMSLEPDELKPFVEAIRRVEQASGAHRRYLSPQDAAYRAHNRRGVYAARDLQAGEILALDMLCFMRPGTALSCDHLDLILGRRLARDVAAKGAVTMEALSGQGEGRS